MGNLCYQSEYKKYSEPKFSNCKKCTVNFRLDDNYYYSRRSCSIHKIKNGCCVICNTKNFNDKCYHLKSNECIIS